jgi:hypothetical protein
MQKAADVRCQHTGSMCSMFNTCRIKSSQYIRWSKAYEQPSEHTNLKAGALLNAAVGRKAAALIDCIAIISVTVATLALLMLLCNCVCVCLISGSVWNFVALT